MSLMQTDRNGSACKDEKNMRNLFTSLPQFSFDLTVKLFFLLQEQQRMAEEDGSCSLYLVTC